MVSSFSTTSSATTSATIPDPVFFNRPKTVTGSTSGLKRTEVAIAPHITWSRPLTDNFDINFSGGIAFLHVSQDVVGDFAVTPPQNVTILQTTETKDGTGPYAQIDLAYSFTPKLGAGGYLRYAGAKARFAIGSEGQRRWYAGRRRRQASLLRIRNSEFRIQN